MKEDLQATIKKVGAKYKNAPMSLRIKIGKILEGKIKLSLLEEEKQ
ncbi:hypothetical protein NPD5_2140 [Clostridium sporogenes]|uniref:Uncharacterized protein n=1 Tax=Clostridium sporogenes TaxID=1509 RepID=A0A1L3NLL0_CLOSG|nr:hypothetical protein [Clostridium sporogenes]APH16964.1 hypothetical protein NPD5_2140 [Clostridium sporogenes]